MLRLQLKCVSLRLSAPTQKMLTDRANTGAKMPLLHGLSIRQISCVLVGPTREGNLLFEQLNAPNEELSLKMPQLRLDIN